MEKAIRTIFWKDGAVVMIDQRRLPGCRQRRILAEDGIEGNPPSRFLFPPDAEMPGQAFGQHIAAHLIAGDRQPDGRGGRWVRRPADTPAKSVPQRPGQHRQVAGPSHQIDGRQARHVAIAGTQGLAHGGLRRFDRALDEGRAGRKVIQHGDRDLPQGGIEQPEIHRDSPTVRRDGFFGLSAQCGKAQARQGLDPGMPGVGLDHAQEFLIEIVAAEARDALAPHHLVLVARHAYHGDVEGPAP